MKAVLVLVLPEQPEDGIAPEVLMGIAQGFGQLADRFPDGSSLRVVIREKAEAVIRETES